MSKKNDDFFVEKKAWSVVKDELLGCYFKPYVAKILCTHRPLVYVDCFAGKGKFDDGNPGSPLIALDILSQCCKNTRVEKTNIETIFIDINYADNLKENLKSYPGVKIISGSYEENINNILSGKDNCNVFLYIDPYGIKALQCSYFDKFANGHFNTIELLINMNSFGFIREACRALGASFDEDDLFEDLVEYDSTKMDASEKSIKDLDDIAGGDYWRSIIEEYNKGRISGKEAEIQFSEKYCKRLSESYTYVLNMPLRIKKGQSPKYRLIHATNHKDGCLIMVDNICNRWEAWQEIQSGGQLTLWEENYDNQMVDEDDIEEKTVKHFSQYTNSISLNNALASFFVKYGPICHTKYVKNILKKYEDSGYIEVVRCPATTKSGKSSSFMTEDSNHSVSVRWLR